MMLASVFTGSRVLDDLHKSSVFSQIKSSVYTGSRNDPHTTNSVSNTVIRSQIPVIRKPQSTYSYSVKTEPSPTVSCSVPVYVPTDLESYPQRTEEKVFTVLPVKKHEYSQESSFLSRCNPFTFFSKFNPISYFCTQSKVAVNKETPPVIVTEEPRAKRNWVVAPTCLLPISIVVGILAAALFTVGIFVVSPTFIILSSILAVVSSAGIIRTTNKYEKV
jgi:hypothetical protein